MDNKERDQITQVPHISVLVDEVLTYLDPQPGNTYLDVTFGAGGHTRALLEKEPQCRVYGMDWDRRSLDTYAPLLQEEFGDRFVPIWGNFAHLYKLVKKHKLPCFNGILADFGTSHMQLKEREGFSFHRDTPLDMRMSPGYQRTTAAQVIQHASASVLKTLCYTYGQERHTKRIVDAIIQERAIRPIKTTGQLVRIIERVVPEGKRRGIHPATQVFQALRIYINKELTNIESFLPAAIRALCPEGRLVCISFHSLEDRIVKQFLQEQVGLGTMSMLAKGVVRASSQELARNPAARSACLRAAMMKKE